MYVSIYSYTIQNVSIHHVLVYGPKSNVDQRCVSLSAGDQVLNTYRFVSVGKEVNKSIIVPVQGYRWASM